MKNYNYDFGNYKIFRNITISNYQFHRYNRYVKVYVCAFSSVKLEFPSLHDPQTSHLFLSLTLHHLKCFSVLFIFEKNPLPAIGQFLFKKYESDLLFWFKHGATVEGVIGGHQPPLFANHSFNKNSCEKR